jgi:hypothetical protein
MPSSDAISFVAKVCLFGSTTRLVSVCENENTPLFREVISAASAGAIFYTPLKYEGDMPLN